MWMLGAMFLRVRDPLYPSAAVAWCPALVLGLGTPLAEPLGTGWAPALGLTVPGAPGHGCSAPCPSLLVAAAPCGPRPTRTGWCLAAPCRAGGIPDAGTDQAPRAQHWSCILAAVLVGAALVWDLVHPSSWEAAAHVVLRGCCGGRGWSETLMCTGAMLGLRL